MNILFFLTPKNEVAYLYDDYTLIEALERMEHRKYSAVPVINRKGEYTGTITEGDILWNLKERYDLDFKDAEEQYIADINKRLNIEAVSINAKIEDLFLLAIGQNFVPVIDDEKIFIGIVTRKDIIEYCYKQLS